MSPQLIFFICLLVAYIGLSRSVSRRRSRSRFSKLYRKTVTPWNPSWQATRKLTMALSWGRDCIFPLLPAQQVDHLHYKNLGRELPFIDVVPLHARTHTIVTELRRLGLRLPVNMFLRIAYGFWIIANAYVAATILALLHVVPELPSPIEIEHRVYSIGSSFWNQAETWFYFIQQSIIQR